MEMAGAAGIEPTSMVLETTILTVVLRSYKIIKLLYHFITVCDKMEGDENTNARMGATAP